MDGGALSDEEGEVSVNSYFNALVIRIPDSNGKCDFKLNEWMNEWMNTRLSCLYFMLLYCANVYLHMDSLFLFLCRVNVFLHQKLWIIVSTAYSRFDTVLDPF